MITGADRQYKRTGTGRSDTFPFRTAVAGGGYDAKPGADQGVGSDYEGIDLRAFGRRDTQRKIDYTDMLTAMIFIDPLHGCQNIRGVSIALPVEGLE